MKILVFIAMMFGTLATQAKADNNFGFNAGVGFPYVNNAGLNYVLNSSLSFELAYSSLNLTIGQVKLGMTKQEVIAKWHPFSGSFFLGLGYGTQAFDGTGTDAVTGLTVNVKVSASAITPRIGWMWGLSNAGFFFGVDAGYSSPSGARTTITSALLTDNQAYIDAIDQGNVMGNTGLPVFTFMRLGYLF